MGIVLPLNSPKTFHDFRSEAATINIDYKMGGYREITVTGKTTGTGTWQILVTNDEDGSKVPQNFKEVVAAAITIASAIASYRWVRCAYTKGDSATGEIAISGIRG